MAVTITSKFYEDKNKQWHDISKVVFTSPNMTSPQIAGKRSHVLPGVGTLGLWYEDTSFMYRVMEDQSVLPPENDVYVRRMTLYGNSSFNFVSDTHIYLVYDDKANFTVGNRIVYDQNNYGTVASVRTMTSGSLTDPDPEITVYNGFSGPIRHDLTYNIYWETGGIYINEALDLYYSLDNGGHWTLYEAGVNNDGHYNFNVSEISDDTILKLVYQDGEATAETSPFVVTRGSIAFLKPSLNEDIAPRKDYRVYWNNVLNYSDEKVDLLMSYDDGGTWITVASGVDNAGYYDVKFPVDLSNSNLKLKVMNSNVNEIVGESDGFLVTFDSSIEVVYPSVSGTLLGNGVAHKVWWNSTEFYDDDQVEVELSYDGGNTWISQGDASINFGYHNFLLENSNADFKLKVSSTEIPSLVYFVMDLKAVDGTAAVLYPSASEALKNRIKQRIWWNSDANLYDNKHVGIDVSEDGGSTWHALASGIVNEGYADVFIPIDYYSNNSKLRIYNSDNHDSVNRVYSYSPVFTTTVGSVTPVYPEDSGTVVGNGVVHRIWWNSTDFYDSDFVDVLVSYDSGQSWVLQGTVSGVNYGYTYINIDNRNADVQVKVVSSEFPEHIYYVADVSAVDGTATVLYPVASDALKNRIKQRVWWNSDANLYDNKHVGIDVSEDGGSTWHTLASGIVNEGYADVFIPIDYYSNNSKLRIYNSDNHDPGNRVYSYSPVFTTTVGKIDVVHPSLSTAKMGAGVTHRIWWNSSDFYGDDKVNVLFSDDAGSTWRTVLSGIENQGYAFCLVGYDDVSVGCKIKVVSSIYEDHIYDVTGTFSTTGVLSLLSPNVSDPVLGGEELYVWWNSDHVYDINDLYIYMSNDGGSNYALAQTCKNQGYRALVLPSTAYDAVKIKIVAGSVDEQISDTSVSFSTEEPAIDILHPSPGAIYKYPIGRDQVSLQDSIEAICWWNTNIYEDRLFDFYVSTNSGVAWYDVTYVDQTISKNNKGYVDFFPTITGVSDSYMFRVEYTNPYGDTISSTTSGTFSIIYPDERLSWGYATTAPAIEYDGDTDGEWSSTCSYNGKMYIVKEGSYKIYEYDPAADETTEFMTFEKIGFLSRPFIAAAGGNFYLVDSVDFAFYEYDNVESDWRSLTQINDRPYCFTALYDDSSYIYACFNSTWYKYGIVHATRTGLWEKIMDADGYSDYGFTEFKVTAVRFKDVNYFTYRSISGDLYLVPEGHEYSDGLKIFSFQGFPLDNKTCCGTYYAYLKSMVSATYNSALDKLYCVEAYEVDVQSRTMSGTIVNVSNGEESMYIRVKEYTATVSGTTSLKDFAPKTVFPDLSEDASKFLYGLDGEDITFDQAKNFNFDIVTAGDSSFISFDRTSRDGESSLEYVTSRLHKIDSDGLHQMSKMLEMIDIFSNSVVLGDSIYFSPGTRTSNTFVRMDLNTTASGFTFSQVGNIYDKLNGKYDLLCTDGAYLYKFLGRLDNRFYRYDVGNDSVYSSLERCPVALYDSPSVTYNEAFNRIYLLADNTDVINLWMYNINNDRWYSTSSAPNGISNGFLVSIGQYVYTVELVKSLKLYRYDAAQDTWSTLSSRPAYDEDAICACAYAGYIYVFCKKTSSKCLIAYRYDVAANNWEFYAKWPFSFMFDDDVACVSIVCHELYFYAVVSSNKHESMSGVYKSVILTQAEDRGVPSGWTQPPVDNIQYTAPSRWEATIPVPYYDQSPSGWVASPEYVENLEVQPTVWSIPPSGVPYYCSSPSEWVTPSGYIENTQGQPENWNEPLFTPFVEHLSNGCDIQDLIGNKSGYEYICTRLKSFPENSVGQILMISEDGRSVTKLELSSGAAEQYVIGDGFLLDGKWYYEARIDGPEYGCSTFGVGFFAGAWQPTVVNNSCCVFYLDNSGMRFNGVTYNSAGIPTFKVGDTIGVAVDCNNKKLWFSKNGEWLAGSQNSWYGPKGSPESGTYPTAVLNTLSCGDSTKLYPSIYWPTTTLLTGNTVTIAFKREHMKYEPPFGFHPIGGLHPVNWIAPSVYAEDLQPGPTIWENPVEVPYYAAGPHGWYAPHSYYENLYPMPTIGYEEIWEEPNGVLYYSEQPSEWHAPVPYRDNLIGTPATWKDPGGAVYNIVDMPGDNTGHLVNAFSNFKDLNLTLSTDKATVGLLFPLNVYSSVRALNYIDEGRKYYFEFMLDSNIVGTNASKLMFGVGGGDIVERFGRNSYSNKDIMISNSGQIKVAMINNSLRPFTMMKNDVVGVAVDNVSGKIWFRYNGVWLITGGNLYSDPSFGVNPAVVFNVDGELYPACVMAAGTVPSIAIKFLNGNNLRYSQPVGFEVFKAGNDEDVYPDDWVPPQDKPAIGPQPDGWTPPLLSGSRNIVVPTAPIPAAPPHAHDVTLNSIKGATTISGGETVFLWDNTADVAGSWLNLKNSIVLEIVEGECYYCRLTAWDDATHSSVLNDMLVHDRCRVSAMAFSTIGKTEPKYTLNKIVNEPVYNYKLKGNIYYYGDFTLRFQQDQNIGGDYMIFKPSLSDIDATVPYGVHDFVITFHYSYT